MTERENELNWGNTIFLTLSPLIGLVGTGIYVYFNGIHWLEISLFVLFYFLTGLSITAGYHRFFAHRSYDARWSLKLFYLIFGAAALENTVLRWASDHRMHHKNVDTDLDPYNIKQGGWYAHIGWILYKRTLDPNAENMNDFKSDPLVQWQSKYYHIIAILTGFALPALIGLSVGRPMGCLLWAGFFRVFFVHHMTFFINSWAHMFGTQSYSDQDTSRDSWWLALLTYGEGYHNFHHKFQADYRNGVRWYQWDPSKWLILAANRLGLADRLNRTPTRSILRAKLAMDLKHVQKNLHWTPREWWARISVQLERRKQRIEIAHVRLLEARARYRALKDSKMERSKRVIAHYGKRLKVYERRFARERLHWKEVLNVTLAQARSAKPASLPSI